MNQRPTLLLLFLFFQPSKLLKLYSHLHPLLHHALVPCAYREQDLVSRSYYTVGRAFVAHAVPCAQEIQVQQPFPYLHSRLPSCSSDAVISTSSSAHCSTSPSGRTPTANRTLSRSYYSHGRAFVAHVVPCAQEIQVQRPFPYVHSRLPLGEFSHFAP